MTTSGLNRPRRPKMRGETLECILVAYSTNLHVFAGWTVKLDSPEKTLIN